jgi:hypothetical protein
VCPVLQEALELLSSTCSQLQATTFNIMFHPIAQQLESLSGHSCTVFVDRPAIRILLSIFISVADPGCLSRIPDPGFTHTGSRIPDPENNIKREG